MANTSTTETRDTAISVTLRLTEAVVCTVQPANTDTGMDRGAFGAGRRLLAADASIAQRANMSDSVWPCIMG
ncbi:MAG: hypothetical protein WCL08_01840 [Verrucomicrobiota bacterium]